MMKKIFIGLSIILAAVVSCGKDNTGPDTGKNENRGSVPAVMETLWKTSATDEDLSDRLEAFDEIQKYADACSDLTFKSYLEADDRLASSLETGTEILACYDAAFSRVLEGIRNGTPAEGEVHIWMLTVHIGLGKEEEHYA